MSTTRTARRRLALAALPVAGLVGLLGSTACSHTDDAAAVSASGTRVSAPTQVETSIAPPTTAAALPTAPTGAAPAPSTGGGSPASAPASSTGGGGAPAPAPTAPAPSTLPMITGIHGPATADCEAASGLVTITVNYTAANATYVEYLAPSSDRPGADAATGSVLFNYDCTQASQVFKIRAFDEFAGSDAKDPSPYVSVTVARRITGGADASTTTAP